MKFFSLVLLLSLFFCSNINGLAIGEEWVLFRSNANGDMNVNISDVVFLDNFLFNGGPAPQCMAAADFDGNGTINITDSVGILNWLFSGGYGPASPVIVPDCSL